MDDYAFERFKALRDISSYYDEITFELDNSEGFPSKIQEKLTKVSLSVRHIASLNELESILQTVATLCRQYMPEDHWAKFVQERESAQISAFDIANVFERYIFYSAEDPELTTLNISPEYYDGEAKRLRQIKSLLMRAV